MSLMRKIVCALCAGYLAFIAGTAGANEAAIRKAFEAKFPKMTVESVTATPFAGIFEVVVEGQILYTDEKVSYMLSGNLLDMRGPQPRNLTQETTGKLNAAALAKSTGSAVKRVKGNGKRVIYTFEDPNCGYCKELQKELVKMNDVTIYTFLWPILSPDSEEKSKAIWCAPDRAKAWDDYMLRGITPTGKRDCDTPIERNKQLARRFNMQGTPGVYLANGQQIGGFIPADKIEAVLASAK